MRVADNKCFPPQGTWGERVYEVVVPETDVNGATLASTSANMRLLKCFLCLLLCQIIISATGG